MSYKIDKSKSYLLTTFLIAHCWYLISYSQEVRGYSFGFMLSTISLIIFIDIIKNNLKGKINIFIQSLLFLIVNLLGLINHIFFGIIILSQILFLFNFRKENKILSFFIFNFFVLSIIYLILMYPFLLKNISSNEFWISQVELKFFLNLFFPRFFGSNIMGYLYLILLVFLIIKNKESIFKLKSTSQLLFIILISSYLFPLIYGIIKIPILIDRYIIL